MLSKPDPQGTTSEDGRGAYSPSDNTVLLIANNIRDLKTARMVLFHESIGHAGVRMTLGDTAFESLIDAVIKERKLDVKAKAKQLGIDDRMAVEEMIAELAEGGRPEPSQKNHADNQRLVCTFLW